MLNGLHAYHVAMHWSCRSLFQSTTPYLSDTPLTTSDFAIAGASLHVASSALWVPRARPPPLHSPHSLFFLPPCLFSCSCSRQKLWKKHFGQIELTTSGKAMEIVARVLLFFVLVCFLLISICSFLAWDAALVRQNYVGLRQRS